MFGRILSTIAVAAIAATLLAGALIDRHEDDARAQIDERAGALRSLVVTALADPLGDLGANTQRESLDALEDLPQFFGAQVQDAAGQVIVSLPTYFTPPPDVARTLARRGTVEIGGILYERQALIHTDGRTVGQLTTAFASQNRSAATASIPFFVMWTIALAFLPLVLLCIWQMHTLGKRARELEGHAAEAREAKTRLLASASDELRTPMNAVLGMLQLLSETDLDSEQNEYADTARRSSEWLLALIEDILDLTQADDQPREAERVVLDLRVLTAEAISDSEGRAYEGGITLRCECDDSAPTLVRGDRGLVRKVLHNLVDNALKFTRDGEVVIGLQCTERTTEKLMWLIEVRDTGVGIPSTASEKLFRAFSQVDSPGESKTGMGLGLALCKHWVERMGGEIGFDSTPQRGSRFWFKLPFEWIGGDNGLSPHNFDLEASRDAL